jgi:hypothetical protein
MRSSHLPNYIMNGLAGQTEFEVTEPGKVLTGIVQGIENGN